MGVHSCVPRPQLPTKLGERLNEIFFVLYLRVKLAVHKETSECVAVKIVHVSEESGLSRECLKKEVR